MTQQFVTDYINKKIQENEDYIRYTFYELKVTNNLTDEELQIFLEMNKNYFENKGYKVYFTGAINLYKIFNDEERNMINHIEIIEDKEYSKDEIARVEHRIIEDIMSNSKNNISELRDKYNGILNKLESNIK